jgi:chromosome segregation ATPase
MDTSKAPIIPGSINITTDEPGIYLDLTENGSNVRKRVGDIVQVNSINDLVLNPETMTGIATNAQGLVSEWSETAVYYALAENALLKYNKNEKTIQKGDTAETIPANSWIQINATSDIAADITSLEARVKKNEDDIKSLDNTIKNDVATKTELNTAKTDLTTAIGTAKTEAITAANEYTDAEIDKVEVELNKKANQTDVEATVATLATKAELEEALKDLSDGDLADLKEAVGVPASEGVEASGLYKAIADETDRAQRRENAIEKQVTDLGNEVAATYETIEAATASHNELSGLIAGNTTAIGNEKTRAEAKEAELAKAISDETARAAGVEEELSEKIAALENADKTFATKTELSDAIGVKADKDAGKPASGLMLEIENAQKAAEATAKSYTDNAIANVNSSNATELAKKLDISEFEAEVAVLNKAITDGDAATLQSAKNYADEKDAETLAAAKKYTDDEIDKVEGTISGINTEVAKKATKEELAAEVKTLNEAIAKAQKDATDAAAADATTKANTAESNAKSYADTELAKKLDTTVFNAKMGLPNEFSGTVYDYINNQDAATLQSAKDYADGILEASDAMVFKGVLGGDGNLTELPAAEATKGGDTYKIGKAGTYAGIECFVGDLLIAKEDGKAEYYHVSSGYEDDYDPVLTAVDADKKVILQDTVGDARGSIKFISNTNSNATVSMTSTVDPQTKIADTVVTIGMEWGSF